MTRSLIWTATILVFIMADHFVGQLIQDLKHFDIYDQPAIIISADYGENQDELNIWGTIKLLIISPTEFL